MLPRYCSIVATPWVVDSQPTTISEVWTYLLHLPVHYFCGDSTIFFLCHENLSEMQASGQSYQLLEGVLAIIFYFLSMQYVGMVPNLFVIRVGLLS